MRVLGLERGSVRVVADVRARAVRLTVRVDDVAQPHEGVRRARRGWHPRHPEDGRGGCSCRRLNEIRAANAVGGHHRRLSPAPRPRAGRTTGSARTHSVVPLCVMFPSHDASRETGARRRPVRLPSREDLTRPPDKTSDAARFATRVSPTPPPRAASGSVARVYPTRTHDSRGARAAERRRCLARASLCARRATPHVGTNHQGE